jgi:NADP-dependent 3-hydroxy acid dehydrogenase YdfG
MSSMFSLRGKVAIVTGASKFTGKTIALEMAKAGADVAVCARTADAIEATAKEIRALGRRSIGVAVDVRETEQVNNFVKKTLDEFGRVDVLVNNAGG